MKFQFPDTQEIRLYLSALWKRLPNQLPTWLKSSAIQQGLMFGVVSIISLVLMASVTFLVTIQHPAKAYCCNFEPL